MDLLDALASFCAVGEARSFTRGAEMIGQPQPVASRRIAALEQRLGTSLLVRSSRQVALTPDGARLLPLAQDLMARAATIEALFAETTPVLGLAVPAGLDFRSRAAIRRGLPGWKVSFVEDDPAGRLRHLDHGTVAAALVPATAGVEDVTVPLGFAVNDQDADRCFSLSSLRRSATERGERPRRVHVLAEDDVPAVRDRLRHAAARAGLRDAQVAVGTAPHEAWTLLHEHDDVVVASRDECAAVAASWVEPDRLRLARRYRLAGTPPVQQAEVDALMVRLAGGLGGSAATDRIPTTEGMSSDG